MTAITFPIRLFRVLYRFVLFVAFTAICSVLAILMRVVGIRFSIVYLILRFWRSGIQFLMNVRIDRSGAKPSTPGIIMPNHRSYVDVLMVPNPLPMVFVAKAEVRKWPVVGWGARAVNVVWVDRKSKESRQETRNRIRKTLERGSSVIMFPEGTTHRGPDILPLKPGMFHSAAKGGFSILPVAIEYQDPDIAWVGDESFLSHFFRHFGKFTLRVKVRFGEPMTSNDGEELQNRVAKWMTENLAELRREWDEKN